MSESRTSLHRAIVDELTSVHGLDEAAAAERATAMEAGVRARFGTWVRRELSIVTGRRVPPPTKRAAAAVAEGLEFQRLSLNVRLQHALMATSVIMLVITGLPLKFHNYAVSKAIIDLFGGPDVSPIVHRVSASLLILVGLWHLAYITVTREGRGNFKLLLPGPKDAVDAFKQIRFYLGRSDDRPRFDKFSYIEKFDYWAVYWGMVIMIGSGLILWFTGFFLQFFPKWFTDIAKEAHSDEALLATLAIVVWHFYNVHFNPHKFPMNRTFITGRIAAHEMIEEHPLEYERVMAGERVGAADSRPVKPGGEE